MPLKNILPIWPGRRPLTVGAFATEDGDTIGGNGKSGRVLELLLFTLLLSTPKNNSTTNNIRSKDKEERRESGCVGKWVVVSLAKGKLFTLGDNIINISSFIAEDSLFQLLCKSGESCPTETQF